MEDTLEDAANAKHSDMIKLTGMVSGLCNLQHKVKGLVDKMKDVIEMNRSGMATATRINEFQYKLDQLQCMLTQDLYKTGEVARCQYRLINDIESFKDIMKCEEKRLKSICADLPTQESPQNVLPYTSQAQPQTGCGIKPAKSVPQVFCLPDLSSNCLNQRGSEEVVQKLHHNLNSEEEDTTNIDLCISDLNPMGKFIKISNCSTTKPIDIGGYALCQQTEDGEFFFLFRFPLRTCIQPQANVKVWSACYDPGLCKSPTDFVAGGIMRWAVCPDVITKIVDNCDAVVYWIKGVCLCSQGSC